MGLPALEFSDSCLDSPTFRERLKCHEIELERTNKFIKELIKDGNTLVKSLKHLSAAVEKFSRSLQEFQFECIGDVETDDEVNVAQSFKEFSQLLNTVEEERRRLIQNAGDVLISPLERFRKEQIDAAREGKKKFDKESEKYYSALEKHLNLSPKKKDAFLQEADTQIDKDKQAFYDASLEYVFKIQEVQERKKFEFVEPLLAFLQGAFNFYHEGYELMHEFEPYKQQLQFNLQNTRNNFESTKHEVEQLMKRIRCVDHDYKPPGQWSMEGFLYIQEKRPIGFTWTRHYCTYEKETKTFTVCNSENKSASRQNLLISGQPEIFKLRSCIRRKTDSIDKRFCFDIEVVERHAVITLQALSESNRRLWLEAMDGKEPIYNLPALLSSNEETLLNEAGFNFVRKCIDLVDQRGLNTVGLYRTGGVNSKVQRLMSAVFAPKAFADMDLDPDMWDNKTITSGLKNYLRCLNEPLLTYQLHKEFIMAVKSDDQDYRVRTVHALVQKLPPKNKEMLELLICHLVRVSTHSKVNLMTVPNLGVVFGPTLMRSHEETVAAVMNIKFQNIVVEILIENYEMLFQVSQSSREESNVQPRVTSIRSRGMRLTSSSRKSRSPCSLSLCLSDADEEVPGLIHSPVDQPSTDTDSGLASGYLRSCTIPLYSPPFAPQRLSGGLWGYTRTRSLDSHEDEAAQAHGWVSADQLSHPAGQRSPVVRSKSPLLLDRLEPEDFFTPSGPDQTALATAEVQRLGDVLWDRPKTHSHRDLPLKNVSHGNVSSMRNGYQRLIPGDAHAVRSYEAGCEGGGGGELSFPRGAVFSNGESTQATRRPPTRRSRGPYL